MTTIYVVTSGSYSDYRIDCLFADKETAELYAGTNMDRQIEEYDIEQPSVTQQFWFRATINRETIQVDDGATWFQDLPPKPEAGFHEPTQWTPNGFFYGTAYGRSPEHARKILSDTLAAAKYNQQAPAFRRVTKEHTA